VTDSGHTCRDLNARERAVWSATFAASFVDQVRLSYDLTQEMGTKSRFHGLSMNECALADSYSAAEVARGVANAAVYGLRQTEEDCTSIAEDLECLGGRGT